MFFVLLLLTLAVSLGTAALVVRFFRKPIGQILDRIIGESIAYRLPGPLSLTIRSSSFAAISSAFEAALPPR